MVRLIKIFILILIIFTSIWLLGDFRLSDEDGSMTVVYTPGPDSSGTGILLPPGDDYSIDVNPQYLYSSISGRDIWFQDYHILMLPALNERYQVTVRYTKALPQGRIIKPHNEIARGLEHAVLNKGHIDKFIEGRKPVPVNNAKSSGEPIVKFTVDSTGYYRIFYSQIQTHSPIDLQTIDPDLIQLFCNGNEIAINITGDSDSVFGPGDYIEFAGHRKYGENTYYDRYNFNRNIYILHINGNTGARYIIDNQAVPDSLVKDTVETAMKTLHIEKDSMFYRLTTSDADTNDFWYDSYIVDPQDYEFNVYLKDRSQLSDIISFSTRLHGVSHLGINPDHPTDIYINNSLIASVNWNDQTPYLYENDSVSVSSPTLTVRLQANSVPGDTSTGDSTLFNAILFDWAEISYLSELRAENGRCIFSPDKEYGYGYFQFNIGGFSSGDIVIVKNNMTIITDYTVSYDSLNNSYTVLFKDRVMSPGIEYFVYENPSVDTPLKIESVIDSNLANAGNRGNTVIIVPQGLKSEMNGIDQLIDGDVYIAGTQEIYNEFSHGFVSPDGIRDFLRTAYYNWEIPPMFVLLAGDGSRDCNNHKEMREHYIPNTYVYGLTDFGYAPSDNYYARIVGDDVIEDIGVSRFPARNSNDIETLKAKIVNYSDSRNQGTHFLRSIIAYDTVDYIRSEYDSRELAEMLPHYLYREYMHTFQDWSTDFLYELDQGASIVNVMSHGAAQMIGYGMFLRKYDVLRLKNINRMPFFTVYSCNTAEYDYIDPDSLSIGEAYMLAPHGGAIGYYGSSGTSEAGRNAVLSKSVFKQFTQRDIFNMSNIVRLGELDYFFKSNQDPNDPHNYRSRDIINYNLFGMGFMDLRIPPMSSSQLQMSSYELSPGDTLTVQYSDSAVYHGNMESIIINSDDYPVVKNHAGIINGTGENSMIIPDSVETGNLRLFTIAYNPDTAIMYESYPSIGNIGIKLFGLTPESPDTNELFRVFARVNDTVMLQSMSAFLKRDYESVYQDYPMEYNTNNVNNFLSDEINQLAPRDNDYSIYYYVSLTDTEGNIYTTGRKSYFVKSLPDIMIDTSDIELLSVNREPFLSALVLNYKEYQLSNVRFDAYAADNADTSMIAFLYKDIAGQRDSLNFKIEENIYINDFLVFADSDSTVHETNEANNIFMIDSMNLLIKLIDGALSDSFFGFYGSSWLIGDKMSHLGSFIAFTTDSIFPDSIVSPHAVSGYPEPFQYDVFNGDTQDIELSMFLDNPPDDASLVGLMRYNEAYGGYELISSSVNDTLSIIAKPGHNKYILGEHSDSTAPSIQIFIENREFSDNILLSKYCELSVVIEDNANIDTESIVLHLNDDTLKQDEYSLNLSNNGRNASIRIKKELSDGMYTFTAQASDIYNNTSSQSLEFRVEQSFLISRSGSFPNPASGNNVVFACRLTREAADMEIHIFNSSGRRIDKISMGPVDGPIVSYRYDVSMYPNGTYYYYFKAADGDNKQIRSKTGKMSVLR
ncbi:MAG: C25 family cysteine peptidase [bacterium]